MTKQTSWQSLSNLSAIAKFCSDGAKKLQNGGKEGTVFEEMF